jgi:hypothetical protein
MRVSIASIVFLPAVFVFSIPCFAQEQSTEPGTAPEDTVFGRESREKVSLGCNVSWLTSSKYRDDLRVDTSGHEARTNLTIKPYVGIRLSDLFELRPAFYYNVSSNKYEYTPKDTTINRSYKMLTDWKTSEARLGFDMGFIFYPITSSFFRFALGPSLGFDISLGPKTELTYQVGLYPSTVAAYDSTATITNESYRDINIPIRVPFSFDFVPSKHLGFRLTGEIFSIIPNIHYIKEEGDNPPENRTITTTTSMNLQKLISDLGIGFFILF